MPSRPGSGGHAQNQLGTDYAEVSQDAAGCSFPAPSRRTGGHREGTNRLTAREIEARPQRLRGKLKMEGSHSGRVRRS